MVLSSVAMRVFACIVLVYLKTASDGLLGPHQFAYRANRSVDDAVAIGLYHILQNLERPGTYASILLIDFSSASYTTIPYKLLNKLFLLNLQPAICHWVLNLLLHWLQSVKVNNSLSKPLVLNTGVPQGCMLSPFLFTPFPNNCVSVTSRMRTRRHTGMRFIYWLAGVQITISN